MKKPTDIERLFQRIGLTDMRYHEFVTEQDPVRARENWSLVDSSVETTEEERASGHVPLARPAPPVRRSGSFYDRVAELRGVRRTSPPGSGKPVGGDAGGVTDTAESAGEGASRPAGPLRDVFSRVRSEPAETQRPSSEPDGNTPLSDVFKRLS